MSTRYACRKRGQCIRQPSPIILRIPPQTNGDSFGSSHTCPRTYQGRRSSRRRDRTSRQVDGGIDRGVSRFGKDAIHLIFLLLSLKKINNCTNWKSSTTPAKLLQTPVEKWGHAMRRASSIDHVGKTSCVAYVRTAAVQVAQVDDSMTWLLLRPQHRNSYY